MVGTTLFQIRILKVGTNMKKVILVVLLALALTLTLFGCGAVSDNTDSPATETTQEGTGGTAEGTETGGESTEGTETDGGGDTNDDSGTNPVNGRTPVTPIQDGGNINRS